MKEDALIKQANSLICSAFRHRRWLHVRQLASFVGRAQSLNLAIPKARLYLRSLHDVIKTRQTWDSQVRLSKQAIRDLRWWAALDKTCTKRAMFREATTAALFTDASMRAWGGVLNRGLISHGLW